MSASGVANEAGSVHRRGVAAYLAAHGLAGKGMVSLGYPVTGPHPCRIAFETDEATDDLTCVMTDESRAFISAKRACGKDKHLKDTVEQWVAQVPSLGDGDRLVLATAEPKGIVRKLGAALAKRRAPGSTLLAGEKTALTALKVVLAAVTSDQAVQKAVLEAAYVVVVDAIDPSCPDFAVAAAIIENRIVAHDAGSAAVKALSQAFHTEAGCAFASGIDEWVTSLVEAQIEVFADGAGPAGAVARARQLAVAGHRDRLGQQDGRVDLSLLTDGLPQLVIPKLAEGLRVSLRGDDGRPRQESLLAIARRWPRLLITGLPGMGKTTALRQLAARWARDSRAPVPIIVRLGDLAASCQHSTDITLGLLCERAARHAPLHERTILGVALEQACRNGRAVLLLDALDECHDKRALVAQGLMALVETLPDDTGVVLATRDSGLTAAQRIELSAAELVTPRNLNDVLTQVLHHAAPAGMSDADREAWVSARQVRLSAVREDHADISAVPLLATLLALVVATGEAAVPIGLAHLLRTAVERSVQQWAKKVPVGSAGHPTEHQLRYGYAALGRRLSGGTGVSRVEPAEAVVDMLRAQWQLGPAAAKEVASQIIEFWDEKVGVFVASTSGTIVARSRVFTEIGVAMAQEWCSDDAVATWVGEAVADPNQQIALLLAAELEPRVMTVLLADAEDGAFGARTLVAAEAVRHGAATTLDIRTRLLDHLARAATEAAAQTSVTADDPAGAAATVSQYLLPLAGLRLPTGLRDRRDDVLASLDLTDQQALIARAHAALADADADGRKLDEAETTAVRAALTLPRPEKRGGVRQISRRTVEVLDGPDVSPGLIKLAADAVHHLDELGDDIVAEIAEIAQWADLGTYSGIADALRDAGHPVRMPAFTTLFESFAPIVTAVLHVGVEAPLLVAASEMSTDDSISSPTRGWRMHDLGQLWAALAVGEASISGFSKAIIADSPDIRRGWIRAIATAAGLDLAAVAAQARLAITEREEGRQDEVQDLLGAPTPHAVPKLDPARLNTDDRAVLLAALRAESDWIFESATRTLWGLHDDHLRDQLIDLLSEMTIPRRRRRLTYLACQTAQDPAATAEELFNGAWPSIREAAVRTLVQINASGSASAAIVAAARLDADLTIRLAACAEGEEPIEVPPPTTWSCHNCDRVNTITDTDCAHCSRGTRPGHD